MVLWTRALDPALPGAPLALTLQVARDEHFEHRVLEVAGLCTTSVADHTLKVRVTHLAPSTSYHYRFVLEKDGQYLGSPGGRTRTGPVSASVRPLHFVVASYPDLLGRDDDTWRRLLGRDEDPDFILFMADSLREAESSSVRDLCRAYRAHPVPRQVHARYPFIFLWEDAPPCSGRGWKARRTLCEYLPVLPPPRPWVERPPGVSSTVKVGCMAQATFRAESVDV
jgi:alkaline phosphatase D